MLDHLRNSSSTEDLSTLPSWMPKARLFKC